jgi:Fe-S cluster assembly protein SufD
MVHPQTYIHMGKNSHAVVVEISASINQHCNSLFNGQTVVVCEQGASCELTRQTNHTPLSLGFHHLDACLMSNSQLTLTELAWGAHYQRHTMRVALKEPSSTLVCHGLMLPNTYEHCDWNSKVTHYAASGNSEQRIKSVIADSGHSSFLGNIAVNQAAQHTNTLMVNENLLLGEKGQSDSAPQLEILADEVKCNHAATITQLDEKALFYLHSRGFSQDDAKLLLLQGFTKDIMKNILHPTVLEYCQRQVARRVDLLLRGIV